MLCPLQILRSFLRFYRYMKQQDLFKVICADLEQEKPNDSAEVKSDRFKKVLDNMKKVKFVWLDVYVPSVSNCLYYSFTITVNHPQNLLMLV